MSDLQTESQPITISPNLARRIQEELNQNVYLCYQCVKCSSGCPLAEYFDWQPNQIMRSLQLGQEQIAFESKTPWLCAGCQTCTTRCPQGLDIAGIMDFLTREAVAQGFKPPVSEVKIFTDAFLREVRLWGRAYELGLMVEMKLRTGDLFGDLDLGVQMIRRNKFPFFPHPAGRPRKVKRIPGASQAVAYYPGCSLHATSPEFNASALGVCEALELQLIEPKGWNCCGSSAAHRSDPEAAVQLPRQNLELIEQYGFKEVTMPCAACFNRHKVAQHEIHEMEVDRDVGRQSRYRDRSHVQGANASSHPANVQVNTLVQTILQHIPAERIRARVRKPLNELKVVAYYGCLLTRPPLMTEAENPENPTDMDDLLSYIGAEMLDWSYKTTCCGASHSLSRPDIVLDLSSKIIDHARQSGADLIAVACPLCHTNLDARQFQMKLEQPMPVLFFTQLMALAFDLPEAAMLKKNLVDPRPLMQKAGVI